MEKKLLSSSCWGLFWYDCYGRFNAHHEWNWGMSVRLQRVFSCFSPCFNIYKKETYSRLQFCSKNCIRNIYLIEWEGSHI
jgi:hypothetical protein